MILGIIIVLLGILSLFVPFTKTIVIWHGWILFTTGISIILASFAASKWDAFHMAFLLGLIFTIFGLGFANDIISFSSRFVSVFLVSVGIFSLGVSVKQDNFTFRGWTFFSGIVSIILGSLILSNLVIFSAILISLFLAIVLFFEGISLLLIGSGSFNYIRSINLGEKRKEIKKSLNKRKITKKKQRKK